MDRRGRFRPGLWRTPSCGARCAIRRVRLGLGDAVVHVDRARGRYAAVAVDDVLGLQADPERLAFVRARLGAALHGEGAR